MFINLNMVYFLDISLIQNLSKWEITRIHLTELSFKSKEGIVPDKEMQ